MARGKLKKIGSLWTHLDKEGNHFLSGTLDLEGGTWGILVFKNKYRKKGTEQPNWIIYHNPPEVEPDEKVPF